MKIKFESKGGFEKTLSWLSRAVKGPPAQILNKIAKDGEKSLTAHTPRKTGETAEGWKSEIKTTRTVSEISWMNEAHPEAEVNVAKLIDQGYVTGTGGYVPPKPYIKKAMEPVFKTAGDNVVKELTK